MSVADVRKALHFDLQKPPEDAAPISKGAKGKATENGSTPPAMDVSSLPMRVVLDIQRHLKRQAHEGALAYSQTALQELQSKIPFQTVVQYLFSLRRECETFSNLFQSDRLLCEELHVAMSVSEAYKVKLLHKSTVDALTTPPEVPAN